MNFVGINGSPYEGRPACHCAGSDWRGFSFVSGDSSGVRASVCLVYRGLLSTARLDFPFAIRLRFCLAVADEHCGVSLVTINRATETRAFRDGLFCSSRSDGNAPGEVYSSLSLRQFRFRFRPTRPTHKSYTVFNAVH